MRQAIQPGSSGHGELQLQVLHGRGSSAILATNGREVVLQPRLRFLQSIKFGCLCSELEPLGHLSLAHASCETGCTAEPVVVARVRGVAIVAVVSSPAALPLRTCPFDLVLGGDVECLFLSAAAISLALRDVITSILIP